jgi:hypothetical protein
VISLKEDLKGLAKTTFLLAYNLVLFGVPIATAGYGISQGLKQLF